MPFSGANCLFDRANCRFYTLFRRAGSLREFLAFDSARARSPGCYGDRVASTNSAGVAFYRDGFTVLRHRFAGGESRSTPAGRLLLGAPGQTDNATLCLFRRRGKRRPFDDLAQTLAIDARHRGRFADGAGPVNPARVTVAIDPRNGMVTGRFVLVDPIPSIPRKRQAHGGLRGS
ncbi:MAG: hypothetical protein H7A53_01385 [Akkermansiaceae bacterium]|nr:hypothetical protein [Akkermansiaceae bacterium]